MAITNGCSSAPTLKQPYFIRPASGAPFAFGALWERWRDPATGEPLESCALITAPAPPHRSRTSMIACRVIIPPTTYAEWLDPRNEDVDRLDRLLDPANVGELMAHRSAGASAMRATRGRDLRRTGRSPIKRARCCPARPVDCCERSTTERRIAACTSRHRPPARSSASASTRPARRRCTRR